MTLFVRGEFMRGRNIIITICAVMGLFTWGAFYWQRIAADSRALRKSMVLSKIRRLEFSGRFAEASCAGTELLTLDQTDPDHRMNIARNLLKSGNPLEAFLLLERGAEDESQSVESFIPLIVAAISTGDEEIQAKCIELSSAQLERCDMTKRRNKLYASMIRFLEGNGAGAIKILESIVESDPRDREARQMIEAMKKGDLRKEIVITSMAR